MKIRILGLLIAITFFCFLLTMHFWGAQFSFGPFAEYMWPGLIRDESWRRSIAHDPAAHGYGGYYFLTERGSAVALNEGIRDLTSTDPYTWFNAALYLGAVGEPAAVPYLIKGLRHRASRAHAEAVTYLQAITGQQFGKNFSHWQQWYTRQNPGHTIDFDSHLGN